MLRNSVLLLWLCVGSFTPTIFAQQAEFFEVEKVSPQLEAEWDIFTGTYGGPHENHSGTASGVLVVTPSTGFLTSTMNLYSFESIPVWTVAMDSLPSSNPFTTVVVQIATNEVIDMTSFGGSAPDEFIDLGPRAELGGFPIFYYWAEWQGLDAQPEFSASISATNNHVSFTAMRVAIYNTDSPFDAEFGAVETVGADSFNVFRGVGVDTLQANISASDNNYIQVEPGFTINSNEAPVCLEFVATSPVQNMSCLNFSIESNANTPGLTKTIEFYNFDAGVYEIVEDQPASFNVDETLTIEPNGNLQRFTEPTTSE